MHIVPESQAINTLSGATEVPPQNSIRSEAAKRKKPHSLTKKLAAGMLAVSVLLGLLFYHLSGLWQAQHKHPRPQPSTVSPVCSPLSQVCPVCPSFPELRTGPSAVSAVAAASPIITSFLRRRKPNTTPAAFEFVFNGAPLQFLQTRLGRFKRANRIFASRDWMPATGVASEFHKACDNVPNVLVIIKSGQYIAGGYTEVPFKSLAFNASNATAHLIPNPKMSTFLFSVNYQEIYPLVNKDFALSSRADWGPGFGGATVGTRGYFGFTIHDDYILNNNQIVVNSASTNFLGFDDAKFSDTDLTTTSTGTAGFQVDEYEVYQLLEQ